MNFKFDTHPIISAFLRATSKSGAAAAIEVPTNAGMQSAIDNSLTTKSVRTDAAQGLLPAVKRQGRENLGALQDLRPGRVLSANSTVTDADYGTIIGLNNCTLSPSVSVPGGIVGVQGPGLVATSNYGTFRLRSGESGTAVCLAADDFRVVGISRMDASTFTASETPPTDPLPNDEWLETSTGSSFWFYDGYWIERIARAEFPNAQVVDIPSTSLTHTLVSTDVNAYIRFSANGAKKLFVPLVGSGFTAVKGCIVTIRNAGASGNVTIEPATLSNGATLNHSPGDNVIVPGTTSQIMYQGSNSWDIL